MEDEFLLWKYVECPMEVHGNFYRGVLKIQRVWNALLPSQMKENNEKHASISVSYTHLTLPTICSV